MSADQKKIFNTIIVMTQRKDFNEYFFSTVIFWSEKRIVHYSSNVEIKKKIFKINYCYLGCYIGTHITHINII